MCSRFFLLPLFFVCISWIILQFSPMHSSYVSVLQLFSGAKAFKLDHFQLVYIWTPTFCEIQGNPCKEGLTSDFSLHGLWPANKQGTAPEAQGNDTLVIDDQLREELNQAWPSIRTDWTNEYLWTYEWNKHGILSGKPATVYLQSVVTQANNMKPDPAGKTNLFVFLEEEKIVPSTTDFYSWNQIEGAVLNGIGQKRGHIYLKCKEFTQAGEKEYHLYEIYVCLDKQTMNYSKCPAKTITNCGQKKADKQIKLPPI